MRRPMSLEHRIKIQKNYVHLVNEMQVDYMLPYFIQEGVITFDIMDQIRSPNTSFGKNDRFLKTLPHRGDKAYSTLLASLKYGSGQLHLVELLEDTAVLSEEIETMRQELLMSSSVGHGSRYSSAYLHPDDIDGHTSSRRTSTCTCNSPRPANNQSPSVQAPAQNSLAKKRKVKKKRKKAANKGHTEQLPEVSHLFPHVVAHIHKKWRQLATALGLDEADFDHIVEIPHEKQSRYAQMVLETWLNKFKHKATKARLIEALEEICVRKAIIPAFKAKAAGGRKVSVSDVTGDVKKVVNKKFFLNTCITDGIKPLPAIKSPRRLNKDKAKGILPIRCEVERISSKTHCQTQQAFLSLADRITDSMVERGDEAVEILNAMERLQGIVFHKVYKGSIMIEVKVQTLLALESLMRMYASKELAVIFEGVLVTPCILLEHGAREVKLTVEILQSDYEECRDELNDGMRCESVESDISSYTPDHSSDLTDTEDEVFNDDSLLLDNCLQLVRDCIIDLQMILSQFDPDVSEFLMTLQLVHPPNKTKIATILELEEFRECLNSSNNQTLSASTLTKYLNIHSHFTDEVSRLKQSVSGIAAESASSHVLKDDYQLTAAQRRIQAIACDLVAVERCLSKTYNFSNHIHSNTVQLTTLETLGYRGLLSYPHSIIDKLYHIIQPNHNHPNNYREQN